LTLILHCRTSLRIQSLPSTLQMRSTRRNTHLRLQGKRCPREYPRYPCQPTSVWIYRSDRLSAVRQAPAKIVPGATAFSCFARRWRACLLVCTALGRLCLLSSRSRVRVALGAPTRIARSEAISRLPQVIFRRPVSGFVPVACPMASRRPPRPGVCCLVSARPWRVC
jgi:hypothetical protein